MKNCCTELVSLGKSAIASAVRFVYLRVGRRVGTAIELSMVQELLSRCAFNNPSLLRTALECEKWAKRSERIDHRFVVPRTPIKLSERFVMRNRRCGIQLLVASALRSICSVFDIFFCNSFASELCQHLSNLSQQLRSRERFSQYYNS
jgi:hypothetical protein